jgi:drug/metabolite transporter (DMT)-like permease
LLLVVLSVLWGGSFFFAGVTVKELPPLTIVLARVAIAATMLLPVMWAYGSALPSGLAGWMPHFVMGLLNNVIPFSLVVTGQTQIASGTASVLNATTPLFTLLVLAAFGDERLTVRRVTGVLLGLGGVVILRGQGLDISSGQTLGMLACLGAALSYGFSGLWGRRWLAGEPPLTSATCQLLCSSAVMLLLAGAVDQPWSLPMPSPPTWLALLGFAALSTALAYLVFFQILVRSGASSVMLVTLMIPVSAILLGHFALDEPLKAREILGAVVIGSALLIIDGRVLAWLKVRR